MRNQLKAALAVEAAVVLIALVFSIVYFVNGWYRSSHMLDVMLIVLWVLVAAVLLVVFRSRAQLREEMVRRFYVSNAGIYNHEIGYAPLDQVVPDRSSYEFVTFAADALARMSYGFEVADAPDDFEPTLMIASNQFEFHLIGEDDIGDLGDPDDQSVVIDKWAGALMKIEPGKGMRRYTKIGTYSNANELASLLSENETVELS